ncbi:MAG: FadR family transcriptional regulator [Acidobacteria bacterium]|nr:FadR family transcriptional regulator [Acidobacteriota bacterium]
MTEEIIRQIKLLIDSGHLPPGCKLPGEREFARLLGVSRPSLREALRALSLLGIVEHRHGSGTYLNPPGNRWPSEPVAMLLSVHKGAMIDIFEARKGLETMVAGLAARRRSDEDLDAMRAALDGMRRNLGDFESYARHERDFHQAVIEAAGNQVIIEIMVKLYQLLQEVRARVYRGYPRDATILEMDFRNHECIYRSIEAGDEHAAAEAMTSHLQEFERLLLASEDAPVLHGKAGGPKG